ncbi:MAG: ubiquinol-cytochrome C chaperone family protein [Alphaproteobacteria bacterium]
MFLGFFRRENRAGRAAAALHNAIANRARDPLFHTLFKVPDNVDGRFDLFTLHAFLILERLKSMDPAGIVGRRLVDSIFDGFQSALREMGVTDAGMSRRIKAMADAFYGRVSAYDAARDETALANALVRNLYRGGPQELEARALAHHIQSVRQRLKAQDPAAGVIDFGPLPARTLEAHL